MYVEMKNIYKKYGENVKGSDIRCTLLIKRVIRNANFSIKLHKKKYNF